MNKQAIVTGISEESLYQYAKRRYAVSASRFGKWAAGLEAVPRDDGRNCVRKPGSTNAKENLTEFQQQAVERGNREHQWFDESCRFWSSEDGIRLVRLIQEQTEAAFVEVRERCEEIAMAKSTALRKFNAARRLRAYGLFLALLSFLSLFGCLR